MNSKLKIAILGCGNLETSIATGLLQRRDFFFKKPHANQALYRKSCGI